MNNVRGLILLSNGGLDGSSRKEENEQGGTEHTRAETIHGRALLSAAIQHQTGGA